MASQPRRAERRQVAEAAACFVCPAMLRKKQTSSDSIDTQTLHPADVDSFGRETEIDGRPRQPTTRHIRNTLNYPPIAFVGVVEIGVYTLISCL